MLEKLINELESLKNPEKAVTLQRFFKTGPGEYGEGDIFLGITVPIARSVAKKYLDLSFDEIKKLLNSKIHEHRFVALSILRINFEKTKDVSFQDKIIKFSFENISCINNWDLVDLFVPYVFGKYYFLKDKSFIYEYIKSQNIWIRRIGVMTCFYDIKNTKFDDILKVCELLLNDKHDLIHKSTGWMLREMGKKNEKILIDFLDKYSKKMSRTMLRYAIEKFSEEKRKYYLGK